jgi:predicted RNA methylase
MISHYTERRTEDVTVDLLNIQGWPLNRPPRGRLIRQNEYKDLIHLNSVFKGKSKTGSGDAYPDFLLTDETAFIPQVVIETKANQKEFGKAIEDAHHYGDACLAAKHDVITIGVAGQEKTGLSVGVFKYLTKSRRWEPVTHQGRPISWIPTPQDTQRLIHSREMIDLAPVVPRPEVLAEKADLINRLLREAHVKDEYRPAHVGAMMLALWQSEGGIRRDSKYTLKDINDSCEEAFRNAGKSDLAKSLHIDEANQKLAASAWLVLATLEQLNVVNASFDHDYLGQLYETFFRYTGGNTIGQYFTPRHITRFMADICEVSPNDIVIDPACGTGGFLIACIQKAFDQSGLKYEVVVDMVKENLIGYESEPVTAALCVANMILRGDGKTGIRKAECFSAKDYPLGQANVALMNPPFPHRKTDIPPQSFVERALESLATRGRLAVILPTSLLAKKDTGAWRERILKENTLLGVAQLPDEIFQPFASATTSVVVLEKGVPHNPKKESAFVRIQYDGLILKKSARSPRLDGKDQMQSAVDAMTNNKQSPGFSGGGRVLGRSEWSPGAFIPTAVPTDDELKTAIDELMRRLSSFYSRYATEIGTQRRRIKNGELSMRPYRDMLSSLRKKNAASLSSKQGTLGEYFDLFYGQKELHSRDGIAPGESLIISPCEEYNGCYGWLLFDDLIKPPFVTVAQTGTIGEAFVQLEPCGVNDDCLILLPKDPDLPLACFFIAAAILRLEKWRFNYGRKLTPSRVTSFAMQRMPELEEWVESKWQKWSELNERAVRIEYVDDLQKEE